MDSIRKLMSSIDNALKDIHITRVGFNVLPGENNEHDSIAMVFQVQKEAFATDDQIKIDSEFEDLISNILHEEREVKKIDEIKRIANEWMDED